MWRFAVFLLVGAGFTGSAVGDTPANCAFEDIKGTWILYEGPRTGSSDIDCSDGLTEIAHKKKVTLMYPNVAVDEYDNKGTWTLIYNQGFEVTVSGRSYFAFSYYKQVGQKLFFSS